MTRPRPDFVPLVGGPRAPTSADVAERPGEPGAAEPGKSLLPSADRVKANGRLSEATIGRLPRYQQVLSDMVDLGETTVASTNLATSAGVSPAIVRKDLSHLGNWGTRGVGYGVAELLTGISAALGLTRTWPVVIVGAGNLGHALARYDGFGERALAVAAIVDVDPLLSGDVIGGVTVSPMADLAKVVAESGAQIAVLAVPGAAAQLACDQLVVAGVTSILSFAPVSLSVPDGVRVRRVDLAAELQILAFHETGRLLSGAAAPLVVAVTR